MVDGPPHYPTPGEITSAASKVVDAAVKMRGEAELRYVPQGDNPWRNIAGRPAKDYEGQAGMYGGFAIGPDGNYLGTDADWAKLRSQYTWIPDLFVHRIDPDPALFQPLIDGMEQTALTIHDDPGHLGSSPSPFLSTTAKLGVSLLSIVAASPVTRPATSGRQIRGCGGEPDNQRVHQPHA